MTKGRRRRRRRQKRHKSQEGMSGENVAWENRRRRWYNQTVWKGWDRQEKPGKVKTYHISKLDDK